MACLASPKCFLDQGYKVQGSDLKASKITRRLEAMGALIHLGQKTLKTLAGLRSLWCPQRSSRATPSLDQARKAGLPVVRAARRCLAELMRLKSNVAVAGTHGKTTTTTMVSTLSACRSGFDPTVVNGGVIHAFESNARTGAGRVDGG